MRRDQLQELHLHIYGIERILRDILADTAPNQVSLSALVEDSIEDSKTDPVLDPMILRGKVVGQRMVGRLQDVQLPQKGGKSTKLFIVDGGGCGSTVYAGTFAFDPDDLMLHEGYDIEYSIKEVEKEDSRFTALASWKPL